MPTNTVTQTQYVGTVTQVSSSIASGWSEAATRYATWITTEQASRVVSATEQYERFAEELRPAYQRAADNARTWADAARSAGNTGIANIMQRYATSFGDTAAVLSTAGGKAYAVLNGIAADARYAVEQADRLFGGDFGRKLGPAFDAAQMVTEKWLRKSEQRYKWKLQTQSRAEDGLADRSF
jgi:hypothetical protein